MGTEDSRDIGGHAHDTSLAHGAEQMYYDGSIVDFGIILMGCGGGKYVE